jgi:ABC-type antimicrobial peptide transport system permease subunit
LALAASDYIRTLLFNLQPHDPAAVAIAIAALTLCGLVAGLIPAGRAAGLDPLAAIRHE